MVKCDKSPMVPSSLAVEKEKGTRGAYNNPDVMEQLVHDFHDKCYICELKGLADPEVEHLIPQSQNGKIDLDLRFDWQNLFLSCPHCNKVKSRQEVDGTIINCCDEDPERHLHFIYDQGNVSIDPMDNDIKSLETSRLVFDVFNLKGSGSRTKASQYRLNALKLEMNLFFNNLSQYKKNKSVVKKRMIIALLKRETAFAAFKREYIRDNSHYPEFQKYVVLD